MIQRLKPYFRSQQREVALQQEVLTVSTGDVMPLLQELHQALLVVVPYRLCCLRKVFHGPTI